MFNSRWKPTDKKIVYDERKLYNYGINRLSVRDYGRQELKQRMQRFQEDNTMVDGVLDKLEHQGYLSDERRITALFNQFEGRESIHKTKNRIMQKGLPKDLVEEIISARVKVDEEPEKDTASELLERKFKKFDFLHDDKQKIKEKMTRFFSGKRL